MKQNLKYIKAMKWAFGMLLLIGAAPAKAQRPGPDSANVIGIERIGIIDSVSVTPLPSQSDGLSFAELLPGAPGVSVTESGAIGAAPLLMIRGVNTINMNASPQIYVDGVPIKYARQFRPFLSQYESTRFGFLNLNDIKSLAILKNADELSAIGGRGANGAIFLTTDRGEFGGTKIEFTANTGFMRANYDVDRMSAASFKEYLKQYLSENGSTESEIANNPIFDASLPAYNKNTDWVDMITRPARYNDYHIKLKGGFGDANYMFSVGYTGKQETIDNAHFGRTTMRFNLDYKLSPTFEITNNLSYANTGSQYFEQGNDWGIHPLYTAVTKAPFLGRFAYNDSGEETKLVANVDALGKSNPWALVNNMKNSNEENRVDGIISAKWKARKSLSLNSALSVSYYNLRESQYRPALGIVNDEYRIRQNANRNSSEFTLIWNSFLMKNGQWGSRSTYATQLGAWVETFEDKALYARKVNAGTDDYETLQQGVVDSASNVKFTSNLSRFYFSGNVDVLDRIYVSANVNAEGSSNFGQNGRWGLYGGAKVYLDLLEHGNATSLTARAGWGRTGNNDLRGFYHENLYYAVNYFGYGGVYLGNIANEDIKPEVTNALDAGLRMRFFNNRLELDGGIYRRVTDNLITLREYPIELGLNPSLENNGSIISKGFEFQLNAKLIEKKQVSWSVFANLTTLDNEVSSLSNGDIINSFGNINGIAAPSVSVGSFYGYKITGVFSSAADVNLKKADGTNYMAGDYIIDDLNKDGKINERDQQVIGSLLPKYYGGFGSQLHYKRLSLSARFAYAYGQEIYNSFKQRLHLMSDYSNQSPEVANRWKSEAAPGNGMLSRAAYGDPSYNGAASSLWVEDGSYTRLKFLSLGYDVPLKPTASFIKGLQVKITGENLFTLTSYSGLDAEVVSSSSPLMRGIDFGASPLPKAVIVGIKLSL
ncbi:SusC/RagA family TonB-linked outer membrane protein [Niabella insulamsoli]|uniref:SusC/RagA family TonB-linked outer membrane protein n=1 Tax=Niabella insulamsoli TaxID=3144874 RepID=UPI0031FBB43E